MKTHLDSRVSEAVIVGIGESWSGAVLELTPTLLLALVTSDDGAPRLPAVVEEVHEEREVLEEELALGLHQVAPVRLLGLKG